MIYVYTKNHANYKMLIENGIMKNDWYFNLYTSNEDFTEADRNLIWQVDNAKLTTDKKIETKYGIGTVRNLSSGCKTLLNIVKNPHSVVNADECGKNVLDILFTMDNIRLYMSRPERISIADDIQICFNETDIVTGQRGYEHWWSEEYERRASDDL